MERTALERDMQEEHEEEYDENADEDFNPDKAAGDEDASSSEDEEVAKQEAKKPQKRKAEDVEELDSGDEATIKERKRKRKKKDVAEAEESGGEGGLVRTRAQRLAEKIERKERKRGTVGEVTIDVDRIWKELNSEPIGRPPPPPPKAVDGMDVDGQQDKENTLATGELITIKRQIEYAGEVTEVEEQVLLSSNEAQRYLKKHPEADPKYKPPNPSDTLLRRPLKRPSMFEPNPTATIKGVAPERLRPRAPSRLDVLMAEKRAEEEMKKKVERMTTVQKSALDWRGFVDQQGLREELDEYGKSKQGYLAREDFLGRADMAREEAGRSARLKG